MGDDGGAADETNANANLNIVTVNSRAHTKVRHLVCGLIRNRRRDHKHVCTVVCGNGLFLSKYRLCGLWIEWERGGLPAACVE